MTHAALALQEVIFNALSGSSELTALIGEGRVYDNVPSKKRPPYVVFGDATHSDWSADATNGLEHFVTLNAWSKEKGRKQVLETSEAVLSALDAMPKTLTDHHLVNFQHEFTEVVHDPESGFFLARMNFRAVTEPN